MNEIILDIIKFSIPAIIVFLTVYVMLDKQARKEEKMRVFELKKRHSKESLPIRLQAYERIMLLIHRIAPENLIPRTQNASMSVKMLSYTLLKTVKSEFEHNITQQVYVSTDTWESVEQYKNNLLSLIQQKTLEFKPEDIGLNLSEAILNDVINNSNSLGGKDVKKLLQKEVKMMFI